LVIFGASSILWALIPVRQQVVGSEVDEEIA
jgi:hypothetical protein